VSITLCNWLKLTRESEVFYSTPCCSAFPWPRWPWPDIFSWACWPGGARTACCSCSCWLSRPHRKGHARRVVRVPRNLAGHHLADVAALGCGCGRSEKETGATGRLTVAISPARSAPCPPRRHRRMISLAGPSMFTFQYLTPTPLVSQAGKKLAWSPTRSCRTQNIWPCTKFFTNRI
jgi:hypothetical protein